MCCFFYHKININMFPSVVDFIVRLQQFVERFDNMNTNNQYAVVKNFILPFLSQPHSGTSAAI